MIEGHLEERERQRDRGNTKKKGGGHDRRRRAEKGERMKCNLIDEKEKQEKGVAVRERNTLETMKCRAAETRRDFRAIL